MRVLLRAASRPVPIRIATTAVTLVPTLASADHTGAVGAARGGGLGWTSWLLVAGAVAAVGLAAWAFFAPDRSDERSAPPKSRPPAS